MRFFWTFSTTFFAFISLLMSQSEIDYKNHVYDEDIHSVLFELNGDPSLFPVIALNKNERIQLSFDDLSGTERDFYYRVIHCNKNWQPSDINEIDYISGFQDERLRKYVYSTNTRINYIHYTQSIPSADFKIKISGNYLLVIYEDNIDYPILTRRFVVSENIVSIGMEQVPAKNVSDLRQNQQLLPNIYTGKVNMRNPLEDVDLVMLQNQNWSTAISSKPNFFTNKKLNFSTLGTFEWPGLDEFRIFDIRRLLSVGRGVEFIERNYNSIEAKLIPDHSRSQKNYLYEIDLNGQFVIDNVENRNASMSIIADYVNVTFTYIDDMSTERKNLYILCDLNNFEPQPKYKLKYNSRTQNYTCTVLLKQGFYSYLIGEDLGEDGISYKDTEGSWADAENDYFGLVYYRSAGDIYDRVIGTSTFNTLAVNYNISPVSRLQD